MPANTAMIEQLSRIPIERRLPALSATGRKIPPQAAHAYIYELILAYTIYRHFHACTGDSGHVLILEHTSFQTLPISAPNHGMAGSIRATMGAVSMRVLAARQLARPAVLPIGARRHATSFRLGGSRRLTSCAGTGKEGDIEASAGKNVRAIWSGCPPLQSSNHVSAPQMCSSVPSRL